MGLPLGIELAAAWVRTMTLSAIAQEISMNRDFLASSSRDVPERHRSVRSVFSHSWQRLTGEEQETLLKLSVFRGGICAEAAAEVAGANLALLTGLVDKSLLTPSTDDRYEQHTLLRQYAEERLAEKPEALVRAQQKHSRYFVEYLADQGHQLRGPGQGEALAAIELELRNIRSAWSWAVANVEAALLGQVSEPFRLFHDQRDLILEGLEQFSRATEALHSVEESAEAMLGRVLVDRAWLDLRAGHYQAAIALAALGLDHLRQHNETRSVILGINAFGAATARRGQYSEALPKFNEALALAQEISDTNLEALSLDNLASTEQARGHTREAERYYRRSLTVSRQAGDEAQVALNLNNLGSLVLSARNPAEAAPLFVEGLQLARRLGLQRTFPFLLANLGLVALRLGKHDHARSRFLEALELVRQGGEAWLEAGLLIQLGRTAGAEGKAEEAAARLLEALETAWEVQDLPTVLEAVTCLVELNPTVPNSEWASGALALVLVHPACQQRDHNLAQTLAQDLHLPPSPSADDLDTQLAATVQARLQGSVSSTEGRHHELPTDPPPTPPPRKCPTRMTPTPYLQKPDRQSRGIHEPRDRPPKRRLAAPTRGEDRASVGGKGSPPPGPPLSRCGGGNRSGSGTQGRGRSAQGRQRNPGPGRWRARFRTESLAGRTVGGSARQLGAGPGLDRAGKVRRGAAQF